MVMRSLRGYSLFAVIMLVALSGSALSRYAQGQSVAIALLFILSAMTVSTIAVRNLHRVRRYFVVDAERLLNFDSRAPVLLLRSFRSDGQHHLMPSSFLGSLWGRTTLEFEIVKTLSRVGPVIAIGRPGEALPPAGASRHYLQHERWEERVASYIEAARMIVVIMDTSDGLLREYELLAQHEGLYKTVLVVPPLDMPSEDLVFLRFKRFALAHELQVPRSLGISTVLLAPRAGRGFDSVSSRYRVRPARADMYQIPLRDLVLTYAATRSPRGDLVSQNSSLPGSTARGPDSQPPMAPFGLRRCCAAAVDLWVGWLLGSAIFQWISAWLSPGFASSRDVPPLGVLAMWMGGPLYVILVEGSLAASLGKRLFGIRIRATDGSPTTRMARIRRAFAKAVVMSLGLPVLAAVFRGIHIHDLLSSTKVEPARAPLV